MDETYNVKAIILNRKSAAEDDSRVVMYSREAGKLELVARGTKKIKSKLAGHLEPFNLADIMVIRGRQYDYVGAAASEKCYVNIKNDLVKLAAAGRAVNIFNKLIKPELKDAELFELLKDYLDVLDSAKKVDILNSLFILKLLSRLGHRPELYNCLNCGNKISPVSIKFDYARGGLICLKCPAKRGLTISENSVKLLRLAEKNDLRKLVKIKIDKPTEKQINAAMEQFFRYNF